jgi:hypothetical protein
MFFAKRLLFMQFGTSPPTPIGVKISQAWHSRSYKSLPNGEVGESANRERRESQTLEIISGKTYFNAYAPTPLLHEKGHQTAQTIGQVPL